MKQHDLERDFFHASDKSLKTTDTLQRAITDLVPEAIYNTRLVLKMNRAILTNSTHCFNMQLREITRELKSMVKPQNAENVAHFLNILKGLHILAKENDLVSLDELNGYIEKQKVRMKNEFFDHGKTRTASEEMEPDNS